WSAPTTNCASLFAARLPLKLIEVAPAGISSETAPEPGRRFIGLGDSLGCSRSSFFLHDVSERHTTSEMSSDDRIHPPFAWRSLYPEQLLKSAMQSGRNVRRSVHYENSILPAPSSSVCEITVFA